MRTKERSMLINKAGVEVIAMKMLNVQRLVLRFAINLRVEDITISNCNVVSQIFHTQK